MELSLRIRGKGKVSRGRGKRKKLLGDGLRPRDGRKEASKVLFFFFLCREKMLLNLFHPRSPPLSSPTRLWAEITWMDQEKLC